MPSALKEIQPLKKISTIQKKKKKEEASHWFSFLIAVYLLILSMVVFNSGTLSLWDCRSQPPWTPTPTPPTPSPVPPPLPLQTPVPKRKKSIFVFLKGDFNIDAFTSTLQPYLFQFHCIVFVIISWVFISFLPYCYYYYFYGCIKCIYVSLPWVTPLLSWARSNP